MGKPIKTKKKAAAAAKKKEMEELALQEQAAVEDEYEFQKTCLEIRIKELETLNLGLQRKSEYLDSQNEVYKAQLEDLREEKDDLVSHLQRCYSAEKTNVKELEDRLYGTHLAMLEERSSYESKLNGKDKTFESMEIQLNKKILDLDSKLTSLEEFRIQKEKLTFEREELQRTLSEERERFSKNYDELENNLIRYRERVKNESVDMVKKMAKDVQRAGKMCLTATVKSAISENVRLQDQLETTSKVNLNLRDKIGKLEKQNREMKLTAKVVEEENTVLQRKCSQYCAMSQELIDRQMLLQQNLNYISEIEKELINLKAEHGLCPSKQEIQHQVETELEKVLNAKDLSTKIDADHQKVITDPKDVEITDLRSVILKMAISAKTLSQASTSEELTFFKEKFNQMLENVYETACNIPNLSSDTSKQLGIGIVPKIMPCISYRD